MAHKTLKPRYGRFAVSFCISALMLTTGVFFAGLNMDTMLAKLLFPLARLMFFITVGLAAGQIIEYSGWTKYLAVLAAPFFRFGRMGSHCSAAFTTAFFSGTAANAMLFSFYKEDKINRSQLYLSNLVNQMPAYFLHLPTTFFIIIPLTGKAGLLYFSLTFSATFIRTAALLLYGHLRLSHDFKDPDADISDSRNKKGSVFREILKKLPARVINITVFVLPIYVFVFMLNGLGFFDFANKFMSRFIITSFMPMESLSVVILSFAAEFTSGFAAAGALMDAGVLNVKQTVIALIIGNIIAFPIRALRHQLPRYMGIFSPKMGLQILLMGQGLRILSLIIVTFLFYLIW